MYEFGEELIIDSFKVPWLIWIQLLVMILLVLLLFFGFSVLDFPNNSTSGASSQGPIGSSSHGNPPSNSTTTLQHRNQNQHTKRETEASTSREIARADESQEREGSAEKDTTVFKLLVRPEHPCNYFGLAKQAFLKCLGFDSDRDNCNTRRHAKED
ncbi:uncharacterized protein LOC129902149 [Solanum dulcamara]|uniref:uncharacterized protein LOC129902149 n=1 Tax=Solanum dulcamara TaxID=45834 RepID=UPI0024867A18|nr:uncharacterized protein LOC129902149 [Solanum dulcamara]XP_055833200.1 uncharacterized protein LOC129902149 [Solanum dulcamara]